MPEEPDWFVPDDWDRFFPADDNMSWAADGGTPQPGYPATGGPATGVPAGDAAQGRERPDQGAAPVVPECLDAGFLPRDASGPPSGRAGRPGGLSGFASGDVLDTALPGPALAGFADQVAGTGRGYAGVNDDELIGILIAWQKTESWAAAGKLSAVAELIRRRPGTRGDRAHHGGIPAEWGKFCADELAVALATSRWAAERTVGLAHDLAARLPRTARALGEGVIDPYKAQIIAQATGVLDDAGAAAAEALVVPVIDGKTPGQIRAAIGRAVLKVDPGAARQRREQAEKEARVELWREDAGTAAMCGYGLPSADALAADQRISGRAMDLKAAGVPGTMDQLRARAYLDFLLGQDTRAVQAQRDPGTGPAGRDPGAGPAGRDPVPAWRAGSRYRPGGAGSRPAGPAGQDSPAPGESDRNGHPASPTGPAGPGPAARINLTIDAGRKPRPSGWGKPGSCANRASLLLDVLPDDAEGCPAAGRSEIGRRPEVPVHDVPVHAAGELRSQAAGRHAFEAVHQRGHSHLRRVGDQQAHMVVLAVELAKLRAEVAADLPHGLFAAAEHLPVQHSAPVLCHEDQVNVKRGNHVPATTVIDLGCHRPMICSGVVQVRYRYRLYPSPGQQQALARTFGCARVVYNDCLRLRDECHAAGEKISDTEVQRRVITLAKLTPERAWLAGVASVALVQACQDARRSYRNWFDSLSGRRKGRRIGHPAVPVQARAPVDPAHQERVRPAR